MPLDNPEEKLEMVRVFYGGPAQALGADGYSVDRDDTAVWPRATALRAVAGLPEHSLTILGNYVEYVVVDSPLPLGGPPEEALPAPEE